MHVGFWWPFSMGFVAPLNPCGIALLPLTLTSLAGVTSPSTLARGRFFRGVGAGLATAIGFTAVVLLLALMVGVAGAVIGGVLRWVMIGLAVMLLVSGLLVGLGRFHIPLGRLISPKAWTLPTGRPAAMRTMILAGALYGIAALSCTLPLFVAVLLPALGAGWPAMLEVVASFGLGNLTLFVVAAIGVVMVHDLALRVFRRAASFLAPMLGALTAGAGAYLLYYWLLGPGRLAA